MTAQPVEPDPTPGWLQRMPPHGWTVEDVLNLPDDASRVELVDGVMRVVPSPSIGHQTVAFRLCRWLDSHAPGHLLAVQAIGVALGLGNTREPDVLLVDLMTPRHRHFVLPVGVTLAVEVVSEGSRRQDRFEKPDEYALAGIPHYWRIELSPTLRVHAYALRSGRYVQVADTSDELTLDQPFEVKLPISEIAP